MPVSITRLVGGAGMVSVARAIVDLWYETNIKFDAAITSEASRCAVFASFAVLMISITASIHLILSLFYGVGAPEVREYGPVHNGLVIFFFVLNRIAYFKM